MKPLDFTNPENLSQAEPRISNLELTSPLGRRLERKLVLNYEESHVLVWWSLGDQEVYPWTPQLKVQKKISYSAIQ